MIIFMQFEVNRVNRSDNQSHLTCEPNKAWQVLTVLYSTSPNEQKIIQEGWASAQIVSTQDFMTVYSTVFETLAVAFAVLCRILSLQVSVFIFVSRDICSALHRIE